MSEINIIRDEQQKLEASQLPESLMEKQNVFARKFKDRRPGHSKDNYLEHRKGKVYQLKPDSNLEWIRETIIDPSKRDNRVLIDVEKYCKKQDLNIIEIQEKHYREFIANHHQVNEVDVDFPETQNKEANANIKNVVKTVKKNKLVKVCLLYTSPSPRD